MSDPRQLSRRERQIMDVLYGQGELPAAQIAGLLPDPPTATAVRTLLRILEDKGHLKRRRDGNRFLYRPLRPRASAGKSALRRVLETFFDGSLEKAVAVHLAEQGEALSERELKLLRSLIDREDQTRGAL